MSMGARLPWIVGVVIAVLAGGIWLMVVGPGHAGSAWTPPEENTLSPADRDALGPAAVDPGAAAPAPDPAVDLTDPIAVAKAYVIAAYSVRDTDAGHTNRRATPYAAPSTPPNTVGVLVLTPPAGGHTTSVAVTDVAQVSGEPTDTRRGYIVGFRTTDRSASATTSGSERQIRYLVLALQFDGHWLVAGDTADAQVGEP
jgi:hypothetical protein